jgi:hypothetical protein
MDVSPLTCSAEELYGVVARANRKHLLLSLSNPAFTEDHVIALLRNSAVDQEIISEISERYDWLASYKVQCAIVNCPKTPHTLAMRFLQALFWNDLLKTSINLRLNPRIRRAAENHLRDKISGLTLGEKISLARTGPRAVVHFLKNEDEYRVITALLRNPHTLEDDVLAMINNELAIPSVLRVIAQDYKWKVRYSIRLALVRNNRTPMGLSLGFLSKLRKPDLEVIAKAPYTRELIRRGAERILSGEY